MLIFSSLWNSLCSAGDFIVLNSLTSCVCACVHVHVRVCVRPDLFAHAVNAIRPQQVHRLLDQVSPAAVEHPEAQVLQELGLCGGGIQLPGSAETIFSPADRDEIDDVRLSQSFVEQIQYLKSLGAVGGDVSERGGSVAKDPTPGSISHSCPRHVSALMRRISSNMSSY